MREGKTATTSTIQKAAILTAFTLILAATGAAFDIELHTPEEDGIISGSAPFEILIQDVEDDDVDSVTLTHNQTEDGVFDNEISTDEEPSVNEEWYNVTKDVDIEGLDDGYAWINVTVADDSGNHSDDIVRVIVDNDDPEINIHSPENNTYISDDSPLLNVTGNQPMTVWNYSINQSNVTEETGTFTPNVTELDFEDKPDGPYNLTVWANDTADNVASLDANFTLDTVKPNATETLNFSQEDLDAFKHDGVADNIIGETSVTLDWTEEAETDFQDDTKYDTTQLIVQEREFDPVTGTFEEEWSEKNVWEEDVGAEGEESDIELTGEDGIESGYEYKMWLRAVDAAGNINDSNKQRVAIDEDDPQFMEDDAGDEQRVPFEWTNDTDPDIWADITSITNIHNESVQMNITNKSTEWEQTLNLTFDPETNESASYTVSSDDTLDLHNGSGEEYKVTVQAADLFGNEMTNTWKFKTDFDAPHTVDIEPFMTADTNYTDENNDTWFKDEHTVQITCDDAHSDPEAVAAYGDGNLQDAWNTSLDGEDSATVTLTEHGDIDYTFKCRDNAGNINDTVEETFFIDRQSPDLDESTVGDGDTGVDHEFTFQANFSDDTGINTSASEADLLTGVDQSGSDSVSWSSSDKSLTMDIDSLDPDESYVIELKVVDNVGNVLEDEIGFRTAESEEEDDDTGIGGGGGGSSVDLLDFESVPSSIDIEQGETKTFDMELMNRADIELSGITINTFTEGGPVFTADDGFSIENNTIEETSVTVDAAGIDPGTYYGDMYVETDEDIIISHEMLIEVAETDPEVSVSGPEDVNIDQGAEREIVFTVENDGGEIDDVSVETEVENVSVDLVEGIDALEANDVRNTTIRAAVDENESLAEYDGTVTVSFDDTSVEHAFTVSVQPGDEDTRELIERQMDGIEEILDEESFDEDDERMLTSMTRDARAALDDGDYAAAAQVQEDIREEYGIDPDVEIEDTEGMGIPVMPVAAALIFTVLVAALGYGAVTRQEELQELLESSADGMSDGYSYGVSDSGATLADTAKSRVAGVVSAAGAAAEQVRHMEVSIGTPEMFESSDEEDDSTPAYTPQRSTAERSLDVGSVRDRFGNWFDAVSSQTDSFQLYEYLERGTEFGNGIRQGARETLEEKREQFQFARDDQSGGR